MALVAAALAGLSTSSEYAAAKAIPGRQPWKGGTSGMAYGTKTRGNMKVRRASLKARNRSRHRAACKG